MKFYEPYLDDFNSLKSGELKYENYTFLVNNIEVKNNRGIYGDNVYINKDNEVVGIKERSNSYISGIIHLNSNQKYGFTNRNIPYYKFTSLSGKFPSFIVPSKSKIKKALYCVIKINKWNTSHKNPIGKVDFLLGPVGNKVAETEILLYKNNIYPKKTKLKYNEILDLNQRIIDYKTFSIDPLGCKDIDDALHYKELDNGRIEIGIHIANVSRYLNHFSTELFSSIYLDNKIINMLEDSHSFNKCSLISGVNRMVLSLIVVFNGIEIENYYFRESIVRNTNLCYQDAERMIHESHGSNLFKLWELTTKILSNNELSATRMVEYYMILYNKLVAETLYKYDKKNTILRTHQGNTILYNGEDILKQFLEKKKRNAALYEKEPINTYHKGLNLEFYTHATSPIRRFVDIINQKNIINILENEELYSINYLDKINIFQKNLKKFYNNYKKVKILFNYENDKEFLKSNKYLNAFVLEIKDTRLKIYIPKLDIEHNFILISSKLKENHNVIVNDEFIKIGENIEIKKFQEIHISITPLRFEEKFSKKLNIKVLDPEVIIS